MGNISHKERGMIRSQQDSIEDDGPAVVHSHSFELPATTKTMAIKKAKKMEGLMEEMGGNEGEEMVIGQEYVEGVGEGCVMEALHQDEIKIEPSNSIDHCFGHTIPSDTDTPPPSLPRHLLQIILNKKVPDHIEPILLPKPDHVMLNHLYALSIKDGMMVLSTTHRHRRKYITTLFYTPI